MYGEVLMSDDTYFLIQAESDGIYVEQLTKEDLVNRLSEGELNFRRAIDDSDPNYWGKHNSLLIKGKIVVPEPKAVITYDIE